MFSMRVTSPRATPKQNGSAPPSPSPALDQPALDVPPMPLGTPLGRAAVGAGGDSGLPGPLPPRTPISLGEGAAFPGPRPERNAPSPSLEAEAENDSAVANVAEDVAPRSNLQALLGRELQGSGSGEGMGATCDQLAEPSDAIDNCTEAGGEPAVDGEETIDDEMDFDQEDVNSSLDAGRIEDEVDFDQDRLGDLQPKETLAPLNLADGYPLPKMGGGSFRDYGRSDSMEPLFGARSAEESVHRTSTSMSTDETADELAIPHLEEDRGANPSSPIIYDMSQQPSSPVLSSIAGVSMPLESPASRATESDIGGDKYFDAPNTKEHATEDLQGADSLEDDSVHVTLPPRVNRTTSAEHANGSTSLFLPTPPPARAEPFPTQASLPMSPRPQFAHTHSLLDDCSDEEETSYTIVDSPTRQPYSCLPPASAGPRHVRKRPNSMHSTAASATQVASNNIHQALLQTRHRRWDCQMAYAGVHAQSNEVFDISSRVHYLVGRNAVRLSVSVEAVQAAALASGLWRTVKLVRLPKGLFWPEVQRLEDNEVWTLLRMLHATFPALEQVDFGGDISAVAQRPEDDVGARDELLACIMECLPNIIAIDGLVVDALGTDLSFGKSTEEGAEGNEGSNPIDLSIHSGREGCVACEAPMCGLSGLVDGEEQQGKLNPLADVASDEQLPPQGEKGPSFDEVGPESTENTGDLEPLAEAVPTKKSSLQELTDDEEKELLTLSASSSMLSSGSWGGDGKPPTCPSSATRQRPRLPTKPANATRKMAKLKRRVLGLIPSVSMMDADDDEDSDGSRENAEESDCPTDIL
ncbi:hypothetical protein ACHAXT_011506 [Thalassiosira profunda]